MVPNSNGHQRRLPSKQHSKIIEFPPTTGGNQGPCRDAGVGEIAPGFAMLKRANALHTLIRQRHLTPLCGGHAPTAERTMNPARMFLESLDRRPGIREQPGSLADIRRTRADVRSAPEKRTSGSRTVMSALGHVRTCAPFIVSGNRKSLAVILHVWPAGCRNSPSRLLRRDEQAIGAGPQALVLARAALYLPLRVTWGDIHAGIQPSATPQRIGCRRRHRKHCLTRAALFHSVTRIAGL